MKKTTVHVSYDEEKLNAIKVYLEQKDMQTETELIKALDALYTKIVPASVREFIELTAGNKTDAKQKKPKSVLPSAVGTSDCTDGDSD